MYRTTSIRGLPLIKQKQIRVHPTFRDIIHNISECRFRTKFSLWKLEGLSKDQIRSDTKQTCDEAHFIKKVY